MRSKREQFVHVRLCCCLNGTKPWLFERVSSEHSGLVFSMILIIGVDDDRVVEAGSFG